MSDTARRFQRHIESFVCEQCQTEVSGNGYTNHCPNCLWSKHVDIQPGDRSHNCRQLMEPIRATTTEPLRILHRCTGCGYERWNRRAPEDSFEVILDIMRSGR